MTGAPIPPDELALAGTAPLSSSEIRPTEDTAPGAPQSSLVTIEGLRQYLAIGHTEDDALLANLLATASTQVQHFMDLPMRFDSAAAEARWWPQHIGPNSRLRVPGPAALPVTPRLIGTLYDGRQLSESVELQSVTSAEASTTLSAPATVQISESFYPHIGWIRYWSLAYNRGWQALHQVAARAVGESDSGATEYPRAAILVTGAYRIAAAYYAYREASDMGARAASAALRAFFNPHVPVVL